MNKRYFSLIAVAGLLLTLTQCDKNPPENPFKAPYPETSLDAQAGQWKTYMDITLFLGSVPAPAATNSAEYANELDLVRAAMSGATAEERDLAIWWGSNGVLRWHEIAREMACNYNVLPDYNADGTYPNPDPSNPSSYPRLPVATPPVTARMMGLLAVAQYDALVACWEIKFQHNRLAPYKNSPDIEALIPTNDLPSYPSEDAVIAAASREILQYIFPGEVSNIAAKAEEHKQSRLWAGANVPSDLSAGDSLGRAIAKNVIENWAKKDKMNQSNNQAGLPAQRDEAVTKGFVTQWNSLEIPARPALLPAFGFVKTWNCDFATLETIRPPAPPPPGSPAFQTAMDELLKISKNRTREQQRITTYWSDGVGTPTPPGHWNRRASDLIYDNQWNEIRAARAMALTCTAMMDAGVACWEAKYYYMYPRPTEMDRNLTTGTGIPNFPAYASGHSTFSAAAAEVLSYLFPSNEPSLRAWAQEAADSRVYGGIHYRYDSEEGLKHGANIGQYAVFRGLTDGSY